MPGKSFTINGKNINDITSFYKEINRVFMHNESWDIGESLDALNDMLYGSFSSIEPDAITEIVWHDIEHSKDALGYSATKAYYSNKLQPGSPFDKIHFQDKLQELKAGNGQMYFDIIIEIIAQHPKIRLKTGQK